MSLSDQKPGVIGAIGTIGQSVKQGTVVEAKKTVENTVEQLSGKEKKDMPPEIAQQAEAAKKQQSQETVDWLYGTSSQESIPPFVKNSSEGKADFVQQLGLEQKKENTATVAEQLGIKKVQPNTTANPLEQVGLGKSNQQTASAAEQLNLNPAPPLTPEEQQKQTKLAQQLHSGYYQRLTTPQTQPDTEERMKEAQEEQETEQQRMERLEQEDLQKKQEDDKKKQPINTEPNIEKNRGSSG